MHRVVSDRNRVAVIAFAYLALAGLALLALASAHVHVGALAVIPILFIAYYVRPYAALLTAFFTGVVLGLFDHATLDGGLRAFDAPPIFDALILSLALCTIVLVADRLRQMGMANRILRGSLQKARRAADHDALTGLVNRAHFLRTLDRAINESTPEHRAAVFFCDLDGFKRINDTHGHAAGDNVLRMAAARLLNAVRAIDVVGRLGGDEFAVLAYSVHDADEASRMAANIEHAFADPFHAQSERYCIGVTVGVSIWPDDGSDGEALLRIADTRMYRGKEVKRTGRA